MVSSILIAKDKEAMKVDEKILHITVFCSSDAINN